MPFASVLMPVLAEVVAPTGPTAPATWGQYAGLMAMAGAVATVVSGAFAAIGQTWVQPYLAFRKDETAARLRAVTDEFAAFRLDTERVRGDYSSRLADLEGRLNASALAEKQLILSLSEASRESSRLSQMLLEVQRTLAPAEPILPPISDRAPVLDGPSVLLIDDVAALRDPLRVLLQMHGFPVRAVGTLAEGLAALSDRPDFVLLDLMLPDGDGLEVLRRVRDQGLPSRVIVITGKDESLLGPVRALRPEVVLIKPIPPETLLNALRGGRNHAPAHA